MSGHRMKAGQCETGPTPNWQSEESRSKPKPRSSSNFSDGLVQDLSTRLLSSYQMPGMVPAHGIHPAP